MGNNEMEALRAFFKSIEAVGKSAVDNVRAVEQSALLVTKPIEQMFRLNKHIADQLRAVEALLPKITEEDLRAAALFLEQWEKLPEHSRNALMVLADHGWYLDPELPGRYVYEAAAALRAGNTEEVDGQLCEYFDGRVSAIADKLCSRFPERAEVIRSAEEAHRQGRYILSIPVVLAQADGICKELTDVQLYARAKGTPRLAAFVDSGGFEAIRASDAAPFTTPTPLVASSEERVGRPEMLNRHAVMHGESLDYGTQLNGCRALSLIVHVAWVFDPRDWEDDAADSCASS